MKNNTQNEIKRGQAISFRVPSDAPDHIIKHLQKLKEVERRNFSSKIAEFVMQGVGSSYSRERETLTIPLPRNLSKSQRDWVKHEHSEALLGNILYHLLTDPVRATALLASLNSKSTEIDEALYLQEAPIVEDLDDDRFTITVEETASAADADSFDDDLDAFSWDSAPKINQQDQEEIGEKEEVLDDLLGDFLAKMNK